MGGNDRTVDARGGIDVAATTVATDHDGVPRVSAWSVDERGRYRMVREIAAGGGGRVMEAHDQRLGREVAIKVPHDEPGSLARLVREAQLMSRLEHPSIVSVHDLARGEDGTPFYVMKLLDGETLRARIAGRPFEERIAMLPTLIAICDAVAYAHHRGIVHRDLKPGNVIVGRFGETSVIDWGLARPVDERDAAGEVVGTPAYMAPEQAIGEPVDLRADVYGLGALIYHVLGGDAPYRGVSADEVVARVLAGPPRPVVELEPRLPPDLAAIVGKAMARDRKDRYADAERLASDLRRYQAGRLVAAHRYSVPQRLWRWSRRHRRAVAGGALAVVAAAAIYGAWPSRAADARAMCAAAGDHVAEVWSPRARAALPAALVPAIDRYAAKLGEARVEACEATHVRGEQSIAQLERRMACLDRRLGDLRATTELVGTMKPDELDGMRRAVSALPDFEGCRDPTLVRSIELYPAESAARGAAEALEYRMATARAAYGAGRYQDALVIARDVLAQAPRVFPPLAAEARLAVGLVQFDLGKLDEAEPDLLATLYESDRTANDWMRADTLLRLGELALARGQLKAAARRADEYSAVVERLRDKVRRIRHLNLAASIADAQGDYHAAVALNREVLAGFERVGDEIQLAEGRAQLAVRLMNTGGLDEASALFDQVVPVFERDLGPKHANYARLLGNVGVLRHLQHRVGEALPYLERANAIFDAAGIHDTLESFTMQNNLAATYSEVGRHEDAERVMLELLPAERKALGDGAEPVATLLYNLGDNRWKMGDLPAAEPWLREALAEELKHRGDKHPRTANVRWALGGVLLDRGPRTCDATGLPLAPGDRLACARLAEARILLEQALPVQLTATGPGSDDVEHTRLTLARLELAQGRGARAAEYAEACLPYFLDQGDDDRGRARLTLARALAVQTLDAARVRALATVARDELRRGGKASAAELAEAERLAR